MTRDRIEPIDRYLGALHAVPGWLAPIDFEVFRAISRLQKSRGTDGDFLEIGTYCGKTAILLKFLCGDDEELVVCDLFESSNVPAADRVEFKRWYGTGVQRTRFEQIFLRYHPSLPRILQMSSTELPGVDLGARFRLIHIDGSHAFETVCSDIRVARSVSLPHGMVAIDDYGSSHCPGIPPAVWQAHFDLGLQPFLVTKVKLYAHWGDYGDDLLDDLEEWSRSAGFAGERYSILGGKVLRLTESSEAPTRFGKVRYMLTPPGVPVAASRFRGTLTRLRSRLAL